MGVCSRFAHADAVSFHTSKQFSYTILLIIDTSICSYYCCCFSDVSVDISCQFSFVVTVFSDFDEQKLISTVVVTVINFLMCGNSNHGVGLTLE